MTPQHLALNPVVAQSQVAMFLVRKSQNVAAVNPAKVHLHLAQNQIKVLTKVLKTKTTEATKAAKRARVAQALVLVALRVVLVRVPALDPTRLKKTLKSLGRNLRRSTPRLKPSWVTIGATAWPRSMLRTASRPM